MNEKYEFITKTILEAGDLLLKSRDKNIEVSIKDNDPGSLLTNVDLEVNEFIKNSILSKYPEDKIHSEETENELVGNESFWSIDPIDGTANFSRGIPHFSIVIAFVEKGEAVVGAVYNPITKELFSFKKNEGIFLNNKIVSVSNVANLKESYFILHIGRKKDIHNWGLNIQRFLLTNAKKTINPSSSSLDLCFLASGRVESVIYGTMTTIDISVAVSMVREAGGEVYDIKGEPVRLSKEPQQIIATNNKKIFDELVSSGIL